MGEIKVAFAALEAARVDVVGTATRIAGRLDDLRRAVVPLAAAWAGTTRARACAAPSWPTWRSTSTCAGPR